MSRTCDVSPQFVTSHGSARFQTYPLVLATCAVLALAAFLFFARLGDRALWTMELRWAEIPREMQLRNDYFWPTINGRTYYDKPLGSYWLVLAAARLTGSLDETAARLPCALSGLLSVLLLMMLARQLYDGRTALISGLVLTTCFSFVFFARTASTDLENVTGELATLVLFLHYERRTGSRWVIGLWLVMALTSLTKGLLGFALPLLILGVYSCLAGGRAELVRGIGQGPLRGRLRWLMNRCRWLCNRWSILGLFLAATVYFAPFAVSWARTGSVEGLHMVYRENVQRFFQPHNHRGPVYLYLYVIFGLMAPWSALLPAALLRVHVTESRDDQNRRGDRFARVYFWATFVFFTLSSSRRSYYLLPLLPAGALLIGRLLAAPNEPTRAVRRLLHLGFAVIAIAVVLVGLALLPARFLPEPWARLPTAPAWSLLGLCWLTSVAAMIVALRRLHRSWITGAVGGSAFLFLAYLFLSALPATEDYRGERTLALETRRLGMAAPGLALYRTREPVFYLDLPQPIAEYDDPESLTDAVRAGNVSLVLARQRDLKSLALPTTIVRGEPTFAWETEEQRGNKLVLARFERE